MGLLAAAGLGVRLGGRPKAFLGHGRHTLLELAGAYLMESCGRLLVGLPDGHVEEGRALLNDGRITCFPGGATKLDTVVLLIAHATEPLLVVHDVSEFMPDPELLACLFDERDGAEAVVPMVRVRHRGARARMSRDRAMTEDIERDGIVMSHTPELYRSAALADALEKEAVNGWQEPGVYALVHRAGGHVRFVESRHEQLKITYPEDLSVPDPA